MRILTVRQPWAWAIIHGGKDVENRVRNIAGAYRGPVAIHAGLAQFEDEGQYREVTRAIVSDLNGWPASDNDLWSADSIEPDDPRFVYGAIIGVVDLVDVHPVANPHFHPICHDLTRPDGLREAAERGDGACSPWAMPDGQWHLAFADPRALDEPIPYKGALGLRELPGDVADQITANLLAEESTR